MPMLYTLVTAFAFALLLAVAALVREVRFRRSLQRLLHRLLTFWRADAHEPRSSPRSDHPDAPAGRRM